MFNQYKCVCGSKLTSSNDIFMGKCEKCRKRPLEITFKTANPNPAKTNKIISAIIKSHFGEFN
ncbi:hypothetical protein BKE17_02710 [Enhydrobacter sp. H5]|nr:hypothetical protein BKE17_02710 [Enhydrobacter sp. H5]